MTGQNINPEYGCTMCPDLLDHQETVKNFKKWFYNVYNEIEKNQEIYNQKIRIQRKLQSDVRLALGLNC